MPTYRAPWGLSLLALGLLSCQSASQAQNTLPPPIQFNFSGTQRPVVGNIVNPFDGTAVTINRTMNVNDTSYVGDLNFDALNMTSLDDALFVLEGGGGFGGGVVRVHSVEVFFAGDGDDFLHLASPFVSLNELTIFGGQGNDTIWASIENDVVFGDAGNDQLSGGPGDDRLLGGANDDSLVGGSGDDELDGGSGDDLLIGDTGEDEYVGILGFDTIIEVDDPELAFLRVQSGFVESDLSFERFGYDLIIGLDGQGEVTVIDQFSPGGLIGVDFVVLDNGNGESIDVRAMFIPEPMSLGIALSALITLVGHGGSKQMRT